MIRRPRPIDWSQIVRDLEAAGMTQREIGSQCDTNQPWVNRLKNIPGTEPKFEDGARLISVWTNRLARPAAEVPRESTHTETT